jgi:GDSL-like Lipase/Acylhydrolase family
MRATLVLYFASALLLGAEPTLAEEEDSCAVADQIVQADFALPHVASAIQQKHLDIVVVGSGSSTLSGPGEAGKAYPARLESALSQAFPGVAIKVVTYIKSREIAADMVKQFDQIFVEAKPALVVWQTGTVDAIQGVDLDDFRTTLDSGIETLRAKNADIVFMNMQYSPRTESMIALNNYADAMRFVALQHEVLLFDRLEVMRHWSEMGTFDLFAATKNTDTAERVHDCLGRLLGRLVTEAEKLAEMLGKEAR